MSDSLVERLQQDVADRQSVDWPARLSELEATADASEEMRREVELLRLLDDVGRAHAEFQSAALDDEAAGPPMDATSDDTLQAWGRYLLAEKVGRGGFGSVYRAWDPVLEMPVALKILHRRYSDARLKDTLLSEGRALAQVRHPNVVRVLNVEQHDGRLGLVMEFLAGETMGALVAREGPLSDVDASMIGEDVCRALAAVHANGLIHRDVKARNIIREAGGRVVLMDFGAGLSTRAAHDAATAIGTPLYMAPETLIGAPATPASDVYGVGVLLFYLLTGQYPYEGGGLEEIAAAHASGRQASLPKLRPDVPARVVKVVERALAVDPQARYATPDALLDALLEARDAGATTVWARVRTGLFIAAALLALVLVGGILTSAEYNIALRRGAYADESVGDWFVLGVRSTVLPVALTLLGIGLLGALAALRRVVCAASGSLRAVDRRAAGACRSIARALSLTDPGVCAAWVLLATVVLAAAIWWRWSAIWTLVASNLSTAPPEVLSVLSPPMTTFRTHYRMALSLLIAANIAAWLAVTRAAGRRRRLPPSMVAIEASVVVLLTLSMHLPYRLLHDVQRHPTASWRGQHCYVLGERAADRLLYCARLTPRIVVVPAFVGPLPASNSSEHPFAPFSPPTP